jgi:hypothetical protein
MVMDLLVPCFYSLPPQCTECRNYYSLENAEFACAAEHSGIAVRCNALLYVPFVFLEGLQEGDA